MGENNSLAFIYVILLSLLLFLSRTQLSKSSNIQATQNVEVFLPSPKNRTACPHNLPLGDTFYRSKEFIRDEISGLTNYESFPGDGLLAIRNLAFVEEQLNFQELEIYRDYRVSRCGGMNELYYLWDRPDILKEAYKDVHDSPPASVYLMAQSTADESVGHMIQEMVLGLRHWAPLLKQFPSLQLGVRNMKHLSSWKIKELFFYALSIPLERMVELDFCSGKLFFPPNDSNLVFFPTPVYIVGKNVREAKRGWEWFEGTILPLAGLPKRDSCSSHPTGMVLVPRKPSHHQDLGTNIFDALTPEIQEWAVREFGAVILDVNSVSDLVYDEVSILASARIIVNVVGSGFEFTTMIARGATIIAPNKPTPWYYNWIFHQALLAYNSQYNRIVFTTGEDSAIRNAIRTAFNEAPLPCPIKVPDDIRFDSP